MAKQRAMKMEFPATDRYYKVLERFGGISGIQNRVLYYFKIIGEVGKQGRLTLPPNPPIVYMKEKMSPPSFAQVEEAFRSFIFGAIKPNTYMNMDSASYLRLGWVTIILTSRCIRCSSLWLFCRR
ncbi:MAG: hypothetical protein H0X31_21900 [Nostocaceae cyanobacterium]|nr:hypothetical protein [Nostocaceae cyanobacterium]